MKNIFSLLITFTLSIFIVKAQLGISHHKYSTDDDWKLSQLLSNYNSHTSLDSLKKVKYIHKKSTTDIVFNKNGAIKSISSTKRNKTIPKLDIKYIAPERPIEYSIYNKRGKHLYTVFSKYKDSLQITKTERLKTNERVFYKKQWKYNDKNQLIEHLKFDKDTTKIKTKWLYEYDREGKKTTSRAYNNKEVLIFEYSFDCNPEGKKKEKKVNYALVCSSTDYRNDYLIETNEQNNLKGKVTRTVNTYLASDTTLLNAKRYDHKDRIQYSSAYNSSNKIISYEWHRRGKLISKSKWEYNGDNFLSRQNYWRGKLNNKVEYIYNEERVIETKLYHKSKLTSTTKIEYFY
jgi:hypothetical protein